MAEQDGTTEWHNRMGQQNGTTGWQNRKAEQDGRTKNKGPFLLSVDCCVSKITGLATDTSRPAAQTVCVTFRYPSNTKNNNNNTNHREKPKQLPHTHFAKSMDYSRIWQADSHSINSLKLT
jgi:hypothetical protein